MSEYVTLILEYEIDEDRVPFEGIEAIAIESIDSFELKIPCLVYAIVIIHVVGSEEAEAIG